MSYISDNLLAGIKKLVNRQVVGWLAAPATSGGLGVKVGVQEPTWVRV